jgi:hypothetical protein
MSPGGAGCSSVQRSTVATGTDSPGRPTSGLCAAVVLQPAIFGRVIPMAGRLSVPGAVMKGAGSCRRGGIVPGSRGCEDLGHGGHDGCGVLCPVGAGGFR